MLIIAVVVSVTIGITKAKLDNIVSYTYYNAYSTLRKISTEMLADWNPKDEEYRQALAEKGLIAYIKGKLLSGKNQIVIQAASAEGWFTETESNHCVSSDPYSCQGDLYIDGSEVLCCDIVEYERYECWDGSVRDDPSQCPPKEVTCWNGSKAPNTAACPPKIKCWDGSYVTNQSQCPSYVTCWNGDKAYTWSGCPACPNKPNKIPCGQSWDENTCKLVGTVKTCPSGQHLNSNCNCVNDCPSASELTPCRLCSEETGTITTNEAINRTCSDETYEWSEEQCKCIPSPRTLPRKGENFCKLFERHANIMSGSEVCSGSVISNGTTNFADKSPDITLRNGLRVYNMHSDARAISDLANNTQGGSYDGVPNTNSYGYTVYVDIDGSRGDSQLWSDVYPFYITLSGKIIPAYDSANPNESGGDSVRHMQVSVENENYNSGRRSIKWLAKSVPFKEGACIAGYVGDSTPYCKNGTSYTQAVECTSNINSFCRVKQIQPVKFFF